jgi:hypothetical protein
MAKMKSIYMITTASAAANASSCSRATRSSIILAASTLHLEAISPAQRQDSNQELLNRLVAAPSSPTVPRNFYLSFLLSDVSAQVNFIQSTVLFDIFLNHQQRGQRLQCP